MLSRTIIGLVLVSVLLAACGEPADFSAEQRLPAAQQQTDEILFVADGNVMRWRDGDVEQVTEDVIAEAPSWAPHGDRFAYVQVFEAHSEVVIADSDGDPLVRVTNHEPNAEPFSQEHVFLAAWAKDPDWNPVAEEIAYASDFEGLDQFSRPLYIWVAERLGEGIPPYPLNASFQIGLSQEDPSYSPDGQKICFTVTVDEGGRRTTEIWTLNLESAIWEQLVFGGEGAFDPAWSPLGSEIAYVQRQGESTDIWIAPTDDGEPYQLTQIGSAVEPEWSPDGDRIVFITQNGPEFEVVVIELTRDSEGRLVASEPERLFTADGIDAPSGLSWIYR